MMRRPIRSPAISSGAMFALFPSALVGQSADELIQAALERHEQRVVAVEDFTLIHEMNGMPMPPAY